MKAPDKIYVRQYRDGDTSGFWDDEPYEDEIAGIEAVEYIRKDTLLEWAKEKQYESLTIVADNFWQEVIDKLNEM